jgi:2-polyprenyl-3-methyl-5-hydroxy-6-metoxy-1,4-benzoquinol methylase
MLAYTVVEHTQCDMCGAQPEHFKTIGRRLNKRQGIFPKKRHGIITTVVRCTQCGLNFTNPTLVPQALSMHYGIPAESYWRPEYFNLNPAQYVRQIDTFKTLHNVQDVKGLRALDIGCGVGKGLKALQNMGFDAYGLEPSAPFYTKGLDTFHFDTQRYYNHAVENAEFDPDSFDLIMLAAVYEHLYTPFATLEQTLNWIKPGGFIFIEVPNSRWWIATLIGAMYRIRNLDYTIRLSPLHSPFHIYEFRHTTFEKALNRLNATLSLYEYHVCGTYLPSPMKQLARQWMKWTNTGMQLEVWITK